MPPHRCKAPNDAICVTISTKPRYSFHGDIAQQKIKRRCWLPYSPMLVGASVRGLAGDGLDESVTWRSSCCKMMRDIKVSREGPEVVDSVRRKKPRRYGRTSKTRVGHRCVMTRLCIDIDYSHETSSKPAFKRYTPRRVFEIRLCTIFEDPPCLLNAEQKWLAQAMTRDFRREFYPAANPVNEIFGHRGNWNCTIFKNDTINQQCALPLRSSSFAWFTKVCLQFKVSVDMMAP